MYSELFAMWRAQIRFHQIGLVDPFIPTLPPEIEREDTFVTELAGLDHKLGRGIVLGYFQ